MESINLVPSQYKKGLKQKRYIAVALVGLALCILGLIFLASLPGKQIKIQEKEEARLDKILNHTDLAQIKTTIKALKQGQEDHFNAHQYIAEIDQVSHVNRATLDILVENIPKGFMIHELVMDHEEKTIQIRGQAQGIKVIGAYMIVLNQTKKFETIHYTTRHNGKDKSQGWIEYDLEIKLESVVERGMEALE